MKLPHAALKPVFREVMKKQFDLVGRIDENLSKIADWFYIDKPGYCPMCDAKYENRRYNEMIESKCPKCRWFEVDYG